MYKCERLMELKFGGFSNYQLIIQQSIVISLPASINVLAAYKQGILYVYVCVYLFACYVCFCLHTRGKNTGI